MTKALEGRIVLVTGAARGFGDSQFNLAIMHENGLGVEKDAKEAFKWFSLAARAGDAEAVANRYRAARDRQRAAIHD